MIYFCRPVVWFHNSAVQYSLTIPHRFLYQHLNGSGPDSADVEALKVDVVELKAKVAQLTDENEDLKSRVSAAI